MVDYTQATGMVKNRLNIVDFFKQRGLNMKRSGSRYWALCPFHNENTPSFSIDENTNRYYCFGCGEHGDIFTYMEKTDGLSFTEALEEQCNALNITLVIDDKAAAASHARKTYMAITAETWRFFRAQYDALPYEHIVKRHEIRMKRGLSSDAKDNHHLFGWAPKNRQELIDHLKSKGYTLEDMHGAGVVSKSMDTGDYYTPWSERLMFPICDILGRPVGFSGRIVRYHEEPNADKPKRKYVNSTDNDIYHKRDLLFCQSIAKTQANHDHIVYVVEGQFDVLAMQASGFDNTVASSGTALSIQQVKSLQRMVGENGKIVFMFDADAAGQKAAIRTFKTIGPIQGQAEAAITEGKDPSDMYHDEGAEALRRTAMTHIPLWQHALNTLTGQHDLSTPDGSRAFINDFMDFHKSISDPIIARNAIQIAALRTGITETTLKSQLGGTDEPSRTTGQIAIPGFTGVIESGEHSFQLTPAMALNAAMLDNPDQRYVLEHVTMTGIDERFRRWLLRETNGGDADIIHPLDQEYHPKVRVVNTETLKSQLGREYLHALYRITDENHKFDLISSEPSNPAALIRQQLEILIKSRTDENKRLLFTQNATAGISTDPAVLAQYERTIHERMEALGAQEDTLADSLNAVFDKLSQEKDRIDQAIIEAKRASNDKHPDNDTGDTGIDTIINNTSTGTIDNAVATDTVDNDANTASVPVIPEDNTMRDMMAGEPDGSPPSYDGIVFDGYYEAGCDDILGYNDIDEETVRALYESIPADVIPSATVVNGGELDDP